MVVEEEEGITVSTSIGLCEPCQVFLSLLKSHKLANPSKDQYEDSVWILV